MAEPSAVSANEQNREAFVAPHLGSRHMPRWDVGTLPQPPLFRFKNWMSLVGPGLILGASAIGGGEWLTGPTVTAQYGGRLLWLCTISILVQALYNVEISRYTLYTGEPIFTGKFRIIPGPCFWMPVYLLLDIGSLLPYLASNAAVPAAAMWLGHLPNPDTDSFLLKAIACAIFMSVFIPLTIGGKVYNSMKALMTLKLIFVMGFLSLLAVCFSTPATWIEIFSGFFQIGNIPVIAETPSSPNVDNVFLAWFSGRSLAFDASIVGFLAAMAGISGNGGLTNTPVSNYTRDQGWGMGAQVGAIPSIVGGHAIELSHVGRVFPISAESVHRWKGWVRHVQREQWLLWVPACFLGIALPSMLSVQFLTHGTVLEDKWLASAITAEGVSSAVSAAVAPWGSLFSFAGPLFWYMTLFCGFLILATSMASTADGVLRRWVDALWTALPWLRKWDTRHIGRLYFFVLCVYLLFGLIMLTLVPGDKLLTIATGIVYNFALSFSCFHVLVVNRSLLPRELQPNWAQKTGLIIGGLFFLTMALASTSQELPKLIAELQQMMDQP